VRPDEIEKLADDAAGEHEPAAPPEVEPQASASASASSSSAGPLAIRSSDDDLQVQKRERADRIVHRDVETQADEKGIEWSSWDLGRSLQLLRSANPAVVRRTLRLLHIRWWHASAEKMTNLLRSAGLPVAVLNMVDAIVDTCRPCRMWKRPGPANTTTSRMNYNFNDVVQHDLMFIKKLPWQHLIDTCTRLTQCTDIPKKDTPSLIEGIYVQWIKPYGPPDVLETDQESGLICEEAKLMLQRVGTKMVEKGVNSHVKMLEKHHDILRQQFLRIKSQCAEEGIAISDRLCMFEAVIAKNALFTLGKYTPLQAVFGRQPSILPDLESGDGNLDDSVGGPEALSRNRHRVREIAVSAMVERTAIERAQRAARSKTRRSTIDEKYEIGDDVEIFRQPSAKDVTGWRSGSRITHVEEDGTIHSKWQGGILISRPQDVRRALTFTSLTHL